MQKRARVPCGRTLSRARLATNVDGFAPCAFTSHADGFALWTRAFNRPPMTSHFARSFQSLVDGFACHAGGRFHVLVSQRMSMVLRSVCVLFNIVADDFALCARFSINRRRFCVPCGRTLSRATRVLFTSPGDDFTLCAWLLSLGDDFAHRACFFARR